MPEMTAAEAAEKLEHEAAVLDAAHYFQNSEMADYSVKLADALKFAAPLLRKIDSGELAPVIHAHWIGGYAQKNGQWAYTKPTCSHCHHSTENGTTKYCPNCNAVMDEPVVSQTQGGKDDSHE